jgi:4-hydroxy-tetrahydrodipicolinate synthase
MSYAGGLIEAVPDLDVFVGSEKLLLTGLRQGAAGCITAGANVLAARAARVYRAWREGAADAAALQADLSTARTVLDGFAPAPAALKAILAERHGGEAWDVRLPLLPLPDERRADLLAQFATVG